MKIAIGIIILLLAALASAPSHCDSSIQSCPGAPVADPYDPMQQDNYNSPEFYQNVPPAQWNWDFVNWNQMDFSRSDMYGFPEFYQNLPADRYDEIDYTFVDYTLVDQTKVDSTKYFEDKRCSGCTLENIKRHSRIKGEERGFPGRHYRFTAAGLEHDKGNHVSIPGPYPAGSNFIVTSERIIVDHSKEAEEGKVISYATDDSVFVNIDSNKKTQTHTINGVPFKYGTLGIDGGRVFVDERSGFFVFESGNVQSGERLDVFADGKKHEESPAYISFGAGELHARGENVRIQWEGTSSDGALYVDLGNRKKGIPGEMSVSDDGLELRGVFDAKESAPYLSVGGWRKAYFTGNGGEFKGWSRDSELIVNVKSTEMGKGEGSLTARNNVEIIIHGNSENRNPFANEGGGAINAYVGDMDLNINNPDGKRTQVVFSAPEEKLMKMGLAEREDFLYHNAQFSTLQARDCTTEGFCSFELLVNKDFVNQYYFVNDGKNSNRYRNTDGSFQGTLDDKGRLRLSTNTESFRATPYILQIQSTGPGGATPLWGSGRGMVVFDGYETIVLPVGSDRTRFLEGLSDRDRRTAEYIFDALPNDGGRSGETSFSNTLTNHHKMNLHKKYGFFNVECDPRVCSTGRPGGIYYRHMENELDKLAEYSGKTNWEIAAELRGKKVTFTDWGTQPQLGLAYTGKAGGTNMEFELDKFRLEPSSFGHELTHLIEDPSYGSRKDAFSAPYTKAQAAIYKGFEWIDVDAEEKEYSVEGQRINYHADRGFNYQQVLPRSHFFSKRCLGGDCMYAELSTVSLDLFTRPDEARDFLDRNSERYREAFRQADEYVKTHQRAYHSGERSPEDNYYWQADAALSPDYNDPNIRHPAEFVSRALGHQLVEGFMAPAYCAEHFGSSCSRGVNDYVEVVRAEAEQGNIPRAFSDERERKGFAIRNELGDVGIVEGVTEPIREALRE